MEDYQFCTACGKEMSPQMTFCPACGTPVPSGQDGQSVNSSQGQYNNASSAQPDKVKFAAFLLFAGAIFSLLIGIYSLVSADTIIQMLVDYVAEFGDGKTFEELFGYSVEALKDTLIRTGYILVACGAVCLVSGVLAYMQKFWMITLVIAVVATVLGFVTTVIGGILGMLVCWYIYSNKGAFES